MPLDTQCPKVCGYTCEVEQSSVVVDDSGLFTIPVYVASDNIGKLLLRSYEVDVDLTTISSIDLILDSGDAYSSIDYPDDIKWTVFPATAGIITLFLGRVITNKTGVYMVRLVVYDAAVAPNGLSWGFFRIRNFNDE